MQSVFLHSERVFACPSLMGRLSSAILDFSVYDAKKAGFSKVVFIIREDLEQVKEAIGGYVRDGLYEGI